VFCVRISTHEGIGNNQKEIGFIFIFLVEAEFLIALSGSSMGGLAGSAATLRILWAPGAPFNRPLTISGRNHTALKESELP
jgi:hypothetical protein